MTPEKKKFEWISFITPILVTIGLFMINALNAQVSDINKKLFQHLTNDELHAPRSLMVMKPEFLIYQTLREDQMREIRNSLIRVSRLMERHADNHSG